MCLQVEHVVVVLASNGGVSGDDNVKLGEMGSLLGAAGTVAQVDLETGVSLLIDLAFPLLDDRKRCDDESGFRRHLATRQIFSRVEYFFDSSASSILFASLCRLGGDV